jgi:hypothetical protein
LPVSLVLVSLPAPLTEVCRDLCSWSLPRAVTRV